MRWNGWLSIALASLISRTHEFLQLVLDTDILSLLMHRDLGPGCCKLCL